MWDKLSITLHKLLIKFYLFVGLKLFPPINFKSTETWRGIIIYKYKKVLFLLTKVHDSLRSSLLSSTGLPLSILNIKSEHLCDNMCIYKNTNYLWWIICIHCSLLSFKLKIKQRTYYIYKDVFSFHLFYFDFFWGGSRCGCTDVLHTFNVTRVYSQLH